LAPLQHEMLYVNPTIYIDMKILKTNLPWIDLFFDLKNKSHIIIYVLEYNFFTQHYENINHDHNTQMFDTLRIIKTRLHNASTDVHNFINSSKYSYIQSMTIMCS
jgi:hypothetical protein